MTAELDVLPARRPTQSVAIGSLMAHATAMASAKQLADALCATDMVPADYKGKPGNGAAAILYGAEIGLNPIQSLQQIFIVHGRPAIYSRTAVALVKRHGIIIETVQSNDQTVIVRGTDTRTGQIEEATWDLARATKAGYTKNQKYQTNPQEMLYSKAAMEVCRKIAPDVLLGISYSAEELDLDQVPQSSPTRVDSTRSSAERLRHTVESAPSAEPEQLGLESAPAVAKVPAATAAQVTKLNILLKEAGIDDGSQDGRAARLDWCSQAVEHRVESTKELTKDEATSLIDILSRDAAGDQ